jgi:hypothetical protein
VSCRCLRLAPAGGRQDREARHRRRRTRDGRGGGGGLRQRTCPGELSPSSPVRLFRFSVSMAGTPAGTLFAGSRGRRKPWPGSRSPRHRPVGGSPRGNRAGFARSPLVSGPLRAAQPAVPPAATARSRPPCPGGHDGRGHFGVPRDLTETGRTAASWAPRTNLILDAAAARGVWLSGVVGLWSEVCGLFTVEGVVGV